MKERRHKKRKAGSAAAVLAAVMAVLFLLSGCGREDVDSDERVKSSMFV